MHLSHSVKLGSRGGDLLDPQLTELGLELTEGLEQILLALAPESAGLDLGR